MWHDHCRQTFTLVNVKLAIIFWINSLLPTGVATRVAILYFSMVNAVIMPYHATWLCCCWPHPSHPVIMLSGGVTRQYLVPLKCCENDLIVTSQMKRNPSSSFLPDIWSHFIIRWMCFLFVCFLGACIGEYKRKNKSMQKVHLAKHVPFKTKRLITFLFRVPK